MIDELNGVPVCAKSVGAIPFELSPAILTLERPDLEEIARVIWQRQHDALPPEAISNCHKWRDELIPPKFWDEFSLDARAILALIYNARYLARKRDSQINTDDNAYLEYRTPFEFTERTDAIVPDLIKYAGWDADRIFDADCSAELLTAAHAAFERRLTRIVPELSEPIR